MNRWLLVFLLLAGGNVCAQHYDTPDAVASELSQFQVVRGQFTQLREVAGVTGGLRSQGEYIFWRGHGIYLGTLLPLQSAVTYRTDKTLQWSGDSSQPREVQSRADKQLRRILMSVFGFDIAQLDRDFEQQWQFDTTGWELVLAPKQRMTAHFLDSISLRGKRHIERVNVRHANGEVVNLEFEDSVSTGALDAKSCISLFAYTEDECEQFLDAAHP